MPDHGSTPAPLNFDAVSDNLVVGSCLRTPADAAKVKASGVDFVLSLQDDADLDKQKVDFDEIFNACQAAGLRYIRFATNEKDEDALRKGLPAAVATFGGELSSTENSTGYVHCNAGRQRAPTIATGYYYWLGGLQLKEAVAKITGARESEPKVNVLRGATWDILSSLGFDSEDVRQRVLEDGGSGELNEEERKALVAHLQSLRP